MRVAAPAVLEVAYGYQRVASRDARYDNLLAWFTRALVARKGALRRSGPGLLLSWMESRT